MAKNRFIYSEFTKAKSNDMKAKAGVGVATATSSISDGGRK